MKDEQKNKSARGGHGFTLLELMVVIVLIGGLIFIAVPSLRVLGGLDLKNEITKIAGLSSEVYALAAISGKTHRIVFDLENQAFWVEEKQGDAGVIAPELGYEDLMKERIELKTKEEDLVDKFLPNFKPVDGPLGQKYELKKDLELRGAWTEQMDEVARSGQVAIYFFTGGYTQVAFVSLGIKGEEDDNSTMHLSLHPLTGEAEINYGEPDLGELLVAESER
jgi:prepilin-type N-terminal cleavage/methylation domain-containing protein